MKLQIKCVSEAKERFRRTITVFAEQDNLFEIEVVDENGVPQDKGKTTELLNMKDADKIIWTVLDEDKETVLFSKESPVTEKFSHTITNKLSGEYFYALRASITGRKDQVDELRIKGYCEPKVLKTSIENDAKGDLCFGHIITVLSETEGVNGNNIKVEIFNEKEICVANLDTKCHEGDIRREGFDTMGWHSKCKEPGCQEEPEAYTFRVRIKDREEYVKDAGGKIDVFEFTIKNKVDTPAATVENYMITTINDDQTDLSVEPQQVGILVLESALVDTPYTVTNDEVNDKKFDHWILKDGNGKDCHWAKSEYREAITKQNIADENDKVRKSIMEKIINNGYKPPILPVMLSSKQEEFIITTWFKVIIPFEVVSVRLTDINQKKDRNEQEVKYTFEDLGKKGGKKDELFKLDFKSKNPFMNQVQHFKKFQLLPEYSLDGELWTPMEIICFEFYITWKNSVKLSTKIQETFLRLGCEYAGNCSTEEEIVEKAFFSFNQKGDDGVPRVYRVREGIIRPNNQEKYLKRNFPEDAKDVEPGMGYLEYLPTPEVPIPAPNPIECEVIRNEDPLGMGRIQVQWPFDKRPCSTWIPTMTPSGGGNGQGLGPVNRGFTMIPEIADSVLVSFLDGATLSQPVVIGSMFHANNSENRGSVKNDIKTIITRSRHMIQFDDKIGNESITIIDKNKNTVFIDTANDNVTITAHNNLTLNATETMTFNARDVFINARDNISSTAGKNIQDSAGNNIIQSAYGDIVESSDNRQEVVEEEYSRSAKKSDHFAGEINLISTKENILVQSVKKVTWNSGEKTNMF